MTQSKPNIYLDSAAATKPSKAVCEAVSRSMEEAFANPASVHTPGQAAARLVEECREEAAALLCAHPDEILFTSGGTESDNAALIGYMRVMRQKGNHLITASTEHEAVLAAARALENEGFAVTVLDVDVQGHIDLDELKGAVTPATTLISLMHANNVIGTVHPIEEAGEIARSAGVAFHTDAVCTFGKENVSVREADISLLTASAHKCYGPKGVGILYKRRDVKLSPLLFGGSQEGMLRPGTVSAPLLAGFTVALRESADYPREEIRSLRDHFIRLIETKIPGSILNGDRTKRLADNVHFSFAGVNPDELVYAMDREGVAISSGSACAAGSLEISHVITAIGREAAGAPARFTLSADTKPQEVESAVEILSRTIARLRGAHS